MEFADLEKGGHGYYGCLRLLHEESRCALGVASDHENGICEMSDLDVPRACYGGHDDLSGPGDGLRHQRSLSVNR